MTSIKKTALAAALAMTIGAGAAEAYPVVGFSFSGTFTMYTPGGGFMYNDPSVTGSMTMDFGTGSGSAAIAPSTTFFGYTWTASGITMTATGPTTAVASMLFNWGAPDTTTPCGAVNCDIPVTVDFSMTPIGSTPFGPILSIVTLDGPGADGIPGNPMCCGPFPGFNATFGGTATAVSYDPGLSSVPVPAAVWLLGSGLLGLVGVARRKKSS